VIAPSWSWAAWNQPIEFPFPSFGYSKTLKEGFTVPEIHPRLELRTDIWCDLVVKQVAASIRECDRCAKHVIDEEEHFCCRICKNVDYYCLCLPCTGTGARCPGSDSGHWMIKRSFEDGHLVDSTTERLAPRSIVKRKLLNSKKTPSLNDTTRHSERTETAQDRDQTSARLAHSNKYYGHDDPQGSAYKKMALGYSLIRPTCKEDCIDANDDYRYRWIYHEDLIGPIGLVEFDRVSDIPQSVCCISMQYDHLDKRNGMRESLHDKTPYEDHCSNGDEESEHSASTEEAVPEQMESEQEEENEEESEQSVDTEAANFWEGHELKEMAEATIPVLACAKNKAGDAYLRIGIGVMFNLKNEFWAPVIEHTGFPEEAKGFSADLDITLV
jgi:hypothetical protein